MSLNEPIEQKPEELRETLALWLKLDVIGVERIGGGRNSQVYKVKALRYGGPLELALKIYFRHAHDTRDRLATEFGAFRFLWNNGIHDLPEPHDSAAGLGWAVYQFIEGEKIPPGQATSSDVTTAAGFLGSLRKVSAVPESRELGAASEACFSPSKIVENVAQRFARLHLNLDDSISEHLAAHKFINEEFTPLYEQVITWKRKFLEHAGISFDADLDWSQRTLSPSDFGFHNALKQPDSRIIFLDFEYFGWDDPAKMIADFLLHPAMKLSAGLKQAFVSAILRHFSDWPGLIGRVESVYPLFGLKWCLILLNEF